MKNYKFTFLGENTNIKIVIFCIKIWCLNKDLHMNIIWKTSSILLSRNQEFCMKDLFRLSSSIWSLLPLAKNGVSILKLNATHWVIKFYLLTRLILMIYVWSFRICKLKYSMQTNKIKFVIRYWRSTPRHTSILQLVDELADRSRDY